MIQVDPVVENVVVWGGSYVKDTFIGFLVRRPDGWERRVFGFDSIEDVSEAIHPSNLAATLTKHHMKGELYNIRREGVRIGTTKFEAAIFKGG